MIESLARSMHYTGPAKADRVCNTPNVLGESNPLIETDRWRDLECVAQ